MIIALTGTGTGVGKTTTGVALVRALRKRGDDVRAWKPIETGGLEDGLALTEASGKDALATIRFREPIAASVASRREGRPIDVHAVAREARSRRARPLVVETAGGLFSPITETETNAELVQAITPDVHILIAPNRLGVLHDVEACRRACRAMQLPIDLVVLTGRAADESVSSNAEELARALPVLSVEREGAIEPLVQWLDHRSRHRKRE